jgi:Tol biopolymer transport system component
VTDVTASALAEALRDRYRLERELGAGGMATVYLAQDVRHHRNVALKVLRPELAAVIGAKRFLHEIETTASLQHPHILPLHDSGEVGGTAFYVMPHVDGESLRDRLVREKQLPIDVTVRIATEVASALDYAHRKGVIHRDIKPENILLHEGQALVADFGIALAATAAGGSRITETGMSLGTPHYMSPEQAMGEREITVRSDVYALGCVVYEMLTGDPPFTGSTAQAIVARVVTETPRPLAPQRHTIPPHIEAAVLTALEKLPADRFASAGDFARALVAPGAPTVMARPARVQAMGRDRTAWAVAGALALLLLGGAVWHLSTARANPRPLVASLLPPDGCEFKSVTSNLVQLSPDGRTLAFIADCDGDHALWVRSLENGESRKLARTAGATYPFWSPDGRSLGFFTDERLKRVDLESGAIRDLAPAPDGRGGTWSESGTILYAPDIDGPLYQVPAGGGAPEPATQLADGETGISHRLPSFLPDGRSFLFTLGSGAGVGGELRVGQLGSRESRKLGDRPTNIAYAGGFLLFSHEGVLMAQRFDPERIELSGSALALAPAIESWAFRYLGNFSAAGRERLVYRAPAALPSRVDWLVPATGNRIPVLERGLYRSIRLSPDGRRILVGRAEGQGPLMNIWLYEVGQATWSRLTSRPSPPQAHATWSPDGREAILQAALDSIFQIVSLDDGQVRSLARSPDATPALDWAPDGTWAVGTQQVQATGFDLTRWSGDSSPASVLHATPADEYSPRISPDGRYLAYISNETGVDQVYLARLPGMTGHVQVSAAGGRLKENGTVAWSRDGRTLYFINPSLTVTSVPVQTRPELRIGRPAPVPGSPHGVAALETGPDGRLLLLYDEGSADTPLTLVENWTALLRRR